MLNNKLRQCVRRLESLTDAEHDPEQHLLDVSSIVGEAVEALTVAGWDELASRGQAARFDGLQAGRAFLYAAVRQVESESAWLDLRQAADLLGYSESGLRRLVQKGAVRFEQARPNARLRFKREWLEEFKAPLPAKPRTRPYKPKHIR